MRHVITTLDVGGAENHLLALVSGFDRDRFEIGVAFLKGEGSLAGRFEEIGVPVERWPLRGAADPMALLEISARLARERPDVVHTHLFKADFYGGLAAWLAGVKARVSTKHNEDPELRHVLFGPLGRIASRVADRVIAISGAVARHVARTTGIPSRRLSLIHYGVDTACDIRADGRLRRDLGIDPASPLVLLVARLEPQKDIPTFIESARLVLERRPDARFAIVGKGSEEARLANLIHERALVGKVHLAGFRPDVSFILPEADVVVLTSRWEGFGLILAEAMAAVRPVVATEVGPVPEVIGDAGICCPAGDAPAIALAIESLLADPERARELGRRGERRVREMFTTTRMVEATMRVYLELLSKKG